jgi:hypothetical protein
MAGTGGRRERFHRFSSKDSARILHADSFGQFTPNDSAHPLKRSPEKWSPTLRASSVAGQEMDHVGAEHPLTGRAGFGAEFTEQTSRGDLQQTALCNQGLNLPRMTLQEGMTFGRGQNTDDSSPAEWVDERLDEVRPPWGKFQQEVSPLFGECENISPEQTSQ